jgi:hypothetical protein
LVPALLDAVRSLLAKLSKEQIQELSELDRDGAAEDAP